VTALSLYSLKLILAMGVFALDTWLSNPLDFLNDAAFFLFINSVCLLVPKVKSLVYSD
jgi:hypothetical protein